MSPREGHSGDRGRGRFGARARIEGGRVLACRLGGRGGLLRDRHGPKGGRAAAVGRPDRTSAEAEEGTGMGRVSVRVCELFL